MFVYNGDTVYMPAYVFDFSCRNYHDVMCTTVLMCYTPLGFKYFTIDSRRWPNSAETFNRIFDMRMLVLQMRNLVTVQ